MNKKDYATPTIEIVEIDFDVVTSSGEVSWWEDDTSKGGI